MAKTKSPIRPVKAANPPVTCIVDGDVGGVGKSLLAILIAMSFSLVDLTLKVFELDEQGKLQRFLGSDVQSLHAARLDADADGERDLLPVFSPFHEALTGMPHTNASVLLEVGGALTELANSFIAEVDVDDDISALGLNVVVFLVMVATAESVRQVLGQAARLERILPSAQIVIVLNERDGCPQKASRDMPVELTKGVDRLLDTYTHIRLPRLRPQSRRLLEMLGESPPAIMSWRHDHFREAMIRTRLPLSYAKRFVNDVADWSGKIHNELTRILPFLGGGHG